MQLKKERLSNSMVGGSHWMEVTGFLWEDTLRLTASCEEDWEDDGSCNVDVIKGFTYII